MLHPCVHLAFWGHQSDLKKIISWIMKEKLGFQVSSWWHTSVAYYTHQSTENMLY